MRALIKIIIFRLVSLVGRHHWPVLSSSLVVLAYHRVLPRSDQRFDVEQPTMSVTMETLESNLLWAKENFKFIDLTEWLEKCREGNPPVGKYCAITFDDGWIGISGFIFLLAIKTSIPSILGIFMSHKTKSKSSFLISSIP